MTAGQGPVLNDPCKHANTAASPFTRAGQEGDIGSIIHPRRHLHHPFLAPFNSSSSLQCSIPLRGTRLGDEAYPFTMDALNLQTVTHYQNWPATVWILLLSSIAYLVAQVAWRPSFPKNAPKLLKEGYPVLGALRFFSDRRNFASHGTSATGTGNFSFYFGKHQIVGLSGLSGRKTFFESRDLNMSEG